MFNKILTTLVMATIGATAIAGSNTKTDSTGRYKEVKQTKTSAVINVSADKLWEIIGPGFENAGVWSTAVDHSVGSGSAEFEGATCSNRTCDINARGFDKIDEKLVEYSDEDKVLAYDVEAGMPGFVTYANNRWRIIEVGPNQSKFEMTITMRMKPFMGSIMGGMFRKNLNKTIDSAIRDLQIYAETGEISDEKKARMAELAGKNAS